MLPFDITFGQPWYGLLVLLLPIMWVLSYKSLSGLGPYRRLFALAFRSLVLVAIVLALTEVQIRRTSEKLTVTYLLDQSESIPPVQRRVMLDYVRRSVAEHRNRDREDCAGVILFAHDAVIEVPPFDDDIPFINLESSVGLRTDATNLASALKMAHATFPEDTARRIVVVSDGNENSGDARAVAQSLTEQGIGIDTVPIVLQRRGEIQVEKLVLPSDIRKGQPIEARVVINNFVDQNGAEGDGRVRGKLKLIRQVGKQEELLNPDDQDTVLTPGKNVFTFEHRIDEVAVYTYKAAFAPADPLDDRMPQNNEATAFTHVRGKGLVLFIEDATHRGEFDYLIGRLRENNIEVRLQGSDELFTSLADLQTYDCVVLGNVPRSSGSDANSVTSFSDEQVRMLVRNTEQFGCGLIMLGGEDSFGAGGWANSELEEAMPIHFRVENARVRAVGALAMIMHASEMAQGNHWQKIIAREAIRPLGAMDYCGMIHWGPGKEEWLWKKNGRGLVPVGQARQQMMLAVDKMTPGDMPQFDPGMQLALTGFNQVRAAVKHMIIISDGDPSPPSKKTIQNFQAQKIKVSTVAVGAHGGVGHQTLKDIATQTGGNYYVVTNPKALPRIFQIEARRVARPLIKNLQNVPPRREYPHEILQGIGEPLPPLKGFVMSTRKKNPLVEVGLVSPIPAEKDNATILAAWTYGLGRSVAFTTDTGNRWANEWTKWENYDKFFTQMVRWAMRPVNEAGKYSVATDVQDGRVRVVVTALDKNDAFLNFQNMSAMIVDPNLKDRGLAIEQTAPGRYVGEFDVAESGSYFVTVVPGAGKPPILTGVNVPYSSEYRDRETNVALLRNLARLHPKAGEPGAVIQGEMKRDSLDDLLEVNTFRHNLAKAISSQDVWPIVLLLAACLFFVDVLVRRVTIHFYWIGPAIRWARDRVFRREREQEDEHQLMDRLRSRKAEIAGQIDQRRAATRFEAQVETDGGAETRPLDDVIADATGEGSAISAPSRPAERPDATPADEDESYTTRLLKAKKKAFKDKQS